MLLELVIASIIIVGVAKTLSVKTSNKASQMHDTSISRSRSFDAGFGAGCRKVERRYRKRKSRNQP